MMEADVDDLIQDVDGTAFDDALEDAIANEAWPWDLTTILESIQEEFKRANRIARRRGFLELLLFQEKYPDHLIEEARDWLLEEFSVQPEKAL
jgi:hypothetical protein